MKKKLQIFVSSTYKDLKEERQAAVEAILSAGHIPAGMELFAAGDVNQLEIIKKWIEESDVYMLILGGRYGSIEAETQKSYTHIEYDYALEKKIPYFSVFASSKALSYKKTALGDDAIEIDYPDKLIDFKEKVLSKICRSFDDTKDIKIAIHESLKFLQEKYDFSGWVSIKDINDSPELVKESLKLTAENEVLKRQLQVKKTNQIDGYTYDEIIKVLSETEVQLPYNLYMKTNLKKSNVWELFTMFQDEFVEGIQNEYGNELELFLFEKVSPKLKLLGIVQRADLAGSMYNRLRVTPAGKNLLKCAFVRG